MTKKMKKALIEENIIGVLFVEMEPIISVKNYHYLYAQKNVRIL